MNTLFIETSVQLPEEILWKIGKLEIDAGLGSQYEESNTARQGLGTRLVAANTAFILEDQLLKACKSGIPA